MPLPRFEKYEIAPCVQLELDDGAECYERRETLRGLTRNERKSLIWSLYGWRAGHGVVCVGDFKTQADAIEIYSLITGHRVAHRDRCTVLTGLPAGGIHHAHQPNHLSRAGARADTEGADVSPP